MLLRRAQFTAQTVVKKEILQFFIKVNDSLYITQRKNKYRLVVEYNKWRDKKLKKIKKRGKKLKKASCSGDY